MGIGKCRPGEVQCSGQVRVSPGFGDMVICSCGFPGRNQGSSQMGSM